MFFGHEGFDGNGQPVVPVLIEGDRHLSRDRPDRKDVHIAEVVLAARSVVAVGRFVSTRRRTQRIPHFEPVFEVRKVGNH